MISVDYISEEGGSKLEKQKETMTMTNKSPDIVGLFFLISKGSFCWEVKAYP